VRLGIRGGELDGLAVKRVSVVETIAPRAQKPQVVVGFGVSRIERDRRFVATGGFVVAPVGFENLPEIVAANGRVGAQCHCPLKERESGREIPRLQRNHAEQIQRVGVLRVVRQYRSVDPLCLGQLAGPMVLERERESLFNAELRHRF
jgi:hypothetical protein